MTFKAFLRRQFRDECRRIDVSERTVMIGAGLGDWLGKRWETSLRQRSRTPAALRFSEDTTSDNVALALSTFRSRSVR